MRLHGQASARRFHSRIEVDASLDLSELTLENVAKLDLLAPFGQENPWPSFSGAWRGYFRVGQWVPIKRIFPARLPTG